MKLSSLSLFGISNLFHFSLFKTRTAHQEQKTKKRTSFDPSAIFKLQYCQPGVREVKWKIKDQHLSHETLARWVDTLKNSLHV